VIRPLRRSRAAVSDVTIRPQNDCKDRRRVALTGLPSGLYYAAAVAQLPFGLHVGDAPLPR
jgi:hypothetical protein